MLSVSVSPVQVAWTQLPTNPNVGGCPRKVPWLGLSLKSHKSDSEKDFLAEDRSLQCLLKEERSGPSSDAVLKGSGRSCKP